MKRIESKIIRTAHRVLKAEIALAKISAKKDQTFEEAIKDKKFKQPETGNEVAFKSLPAEEQKKIRSEFDKANPSEKELSKEDKKVLDELSDLDLNTDDFLALFDEAVAEMDLSDPPDLGELKDMDSDELEDQAESLLKNYDGGLEALQKSLENMTDDDDSTGLDKILNKETKLTSKSQAHYDEIETLVLSEAIDEDTLKGLVENLLGESRSDDFDEVLDTGIDDLDSDQLMKLMKGVFSQDNEVAGELNNQIQKMVVENIVESGEYPTSDDLGGEISSILGDLEDDMDSGDFSDMSLDDLKEVKKRYDSAKSKVKEEYKKTREDLMEKLGDNEELVVKALLDLGLNPDLDLDDDDQLAEELADYDLSLGEDFDALLKEKTKEEKGKADKAKADKAEKARKKDEEEKAKSKQDKAKGNRDKAKDKSYRDKAKKELSEKMGELSKKMSERGLYAEQKEEFMGEVFGSLADAYGIEDSNDLSELDDDALKDFIDAQMSVDKDLTSMINEKIQAENKEIKASPAKLKELKSQSKKMKSKFDELENLDWEGMSEEDRDKVGGEWSDLDEGLADLNTQVEEMEEFAGLRERKDLVSALGSFGGSNSSLLGDALNVQGDRAKKKEFEDAKKKEEEDHKQMVKDYTKKIGDITSSADSADSSDKVNELWGEFGRIKGQLTGSKVLDEIKGDMDKARKSLEKAQEKNSFGGKLKSFFGWGKKASAVQRHKVAKIALEMLKEEIALYKEEESKRNKRG